MPETNEPMPVPLTQVQPAQPAPGAAVPLTQSEPAQTTTVEPEKMPEPVESPEETIPPPPKPKEPAASKKKRK